MFINNTGFHENTMGLKDLKARQGDVNLVVEVIDKGEEREFQKFGRTGRVCNITVKDDTGEMKMTLWNDDIDRINVGDRIEIKKGYVGEWQGEPQLTTGKFGSLEVVEQGKGAPAIEEKKEEKEPAADAEEPPAEEKQDTAPEVTEDVVEEEVPNGDEEKKD